MNRKIPVIVLSACFMGLLLTPLAYVSIGALGGFSSAFSMLSVPLLLGSTLFLLFRLLPRIPAPELTRTWSMAIEAVSWLLLGLFLIIVSGFTLLTTWERIGLFCVLLWVAAVLVAPLIFLRPSALVSRVAQWPAPIVLVGSVSFAGLSIVCAVIYLLIPSRFL
jgi:hypothetical protein